MYTERMACKEYTGCFMGWSLSNKLYIKNFYKNTIDHQDFSSLYIKKTRIKFLKQNFTNVQCVQRWLRNIHPNNDSICSIHKLAYHG